MISIDRDKCIGCGQCVNDCYPNKLEMSGKDVVIKDGRCMECGHCIAVCPTGAITLEGYDMDEVISLKEIESTIDPEIYMNHLKGRRSIRRFKNIPVSDEDIKRIIDAGRFSPTGGNQQNVAYFVSQKETKVLKDYLYDELKLMGEESIRLNQKISFYSDMWVAMHQPYKEQGIDRLFFDAGTAIVISSNSPQSAIIAAAHMETMVYALGLGMLYSGFSERAMNHSEEIRRYLQLKDDYKVYAVLIIGYPDVSYLNSVPRKKADVIWK